jgi:hypothetical protein
MSLFNDKIRKEVLRKDVAKLRDTMEDFAGDQTVERWVEANPTERFSGWFNLYNVLWKDDQLDMEMFMKVSEVAQCDVNLKQEFQRFVDHKLKQNPRLVQQLTESGMVLKVLKDNASTPNVERIQEVENQAEKIFDSTQNKTSCDNPNMAERRTPPQRSTVTAGLPKQLLARWAQKHGEAAERYALDPAVLNGILSLEGQPLNPKQQSRFNRYKKMIARLRSGATQILPSENYADIQAENLRDMRAAQGLRQQRLRKTLRRTPPTTMNDHVKRLGKAWSAKRNAQLARRTPPAAAPAAAPASAPAARRTPPAAAPAAAPAVAPVENGNIPAPEYDEPVDEFPGRTRVMREQREILEAMARRPIAPQPRAGQGRQKNIIHDENHPAVKAFWKRAMKKEKLLRKRNEHIMSVKKAKQVLTNRVNRVKADNVVAYKLASDKLQKRRAAAAAKPKLSAKARRASWKANNPVRKVRVPDPDDDPVDRHVNTNSKKVVRKGYQRQSYTKHTADGRAGSELTVSEWMDMAKRRFVRNKRYTSHIPIPRFEKPNGQVRKPLGIGALGKYHAMRTIFAVDENAMKGTRYEDHKRGIKNLEKRIMNFIASDNRFKSRDFYFNPTDDYKRKTSNVLENVEMHGRPHKNGWGSIPQDLYVGYKIWKKLKQIGRFLPKEFGIPQRYVTDEWGKRVKDEQGNDIENIEYIHFYNTMDDLQERIVQTLRIPRDNLDSGALWRTAMRLRSHPNVNISEFYAATMRKTMENNKVNKTRRLYAKQLKTQDKLKKQNVKAKAEDLLVAHSLESGMHSNVSKLLENRDSPEALYKRWRNRYLKVSDQVKDAHRDVTNLRAALKDARGTKTTNPQKWNEAKRLLNQARDIVDKTEKKLKVMEAKAALKGLDWKVITSRAQNVIARGRANAPDFTRRARRLIKPEDVEPYPRQEPYVPKPGRLGKIAKPNARAKRRYDDEEKVSNKKVSQKKNKKPAAADVLRVPAPLGMYDINFY